MTSHARLEYAERGMHRDCIKAAEHRFGRDWFRTEVYRTEDGQVRVETYRQIGCYWKRERKTGALGQINGAIRGQMLRSVLTLGEGAG